MTPVFSGRAKLVISLAKYGFAPRCAVFDVLSLSLNKESTKEIRFRQAEIASLLVRSREHRAGRGRKHCQPRRSLLELPGIAALHGGQRRKT